MTCTIRSRHCVTYDPFEIRRALIAQRPDNARVAKYIAMGLATSGSWGRFINGLEVSRASLLEHLKQLTEVYPHWSRRNPERLDYLREFVITYRREV